MLRAHVDLPIEIVYCIMEYLELNISIYVIEYLEDCKIQNQQQSLLENLYSLYDESTPLYYLKSYFIKLLFGYKEGGGRSRIFLVWPNIKYCNLYEWPYGKNQDFNLTISVLSNFIPSHCRGLTLNSKLSSPINFMSQYLKHGKNNLTIEKLDFSPYSYRVLKLWNNEFLKSRMNIINREQSFISIIRYLNIKSDESSLLHNFNALIENKLDNLKYLDLSGMTFPCQRKFYRNSLDYIQNCVGWFDKLFYNSPKLQVLKLNYLFGSIENNQLEDEYSKETRILFKSIVHSLCSSKVSLKELSLDGCDLTDDSLVEILTTMKNLQKLSLKYNIGIKLDHEKYETCTNKSLEYLDLSFCSLDYFTGFLTLLDNINNCKVLKIAGNYSLSLFTESMNTILRKLPNIKCLDVRKSLQNEKDLIPSKFITKLKINHNVCMRESCNLRYLEINSFTISNRHIGTLLENCKIPLRILKLIDTGLTSSSAQKISEHFQSQKENRGIEELDLSMNNITDIGCHAIFQISTLKVLNLARNNEISNGCFKSPISLPPRMHSLDMSHTNIAANTACEAIFNRIVDSKRGFRRLQLLIISHTLIGDEIIDYLKRSWSLRFLDLTDCRVSKSGKQDILKSCKFIGEVLL